MASEAMKMINDLIELIMLLLNPDCPLEQNM